MLTTVEGIYKEGKVDLSEQPEGITEARVIVVFLDANGNIPEKAITQTIPSYIKRGQFPTLREVSEEDFKMAEWHGDADDI